MNRREYGKNFFCFFDDRMLVSFVFREKGPYPNKIKN